MNSKHKILISLSFAVILSGFTQSQEKPVIISSKVGEQIDAKERKQYGLFGGKFTDFQSAGFYRTANGKYFVKLSYTVSGNVSADTVFDTDESTLYSAALRVEFFEDISHGINPLNPKFSIDSTGGYYFVKIANVYPDKLPFAKSVSRTRTTYPDIGFGASVSYVFVDLTPVKTFFEAAENTFRQEGYTITPNKINFSSSTLYTFSLYIRLYQSWGIDFETGKSIGSDADFWYSAGYLSWHLDLKNPAGIKPYAAIGIGKYSYYVEYIYNATLDPGTYLEKISSAGGKAGYFFKTGIDMGPSAGGKYLPFCFNVFAVYSHIPEIKSQDYGFETKVKLGGFRLGAGIRFYF